VHPPPVSVNYFVPGRLNLEAAANMVQRWFSNLEILERDGQRSRS
jgi:hypothetical protein